MKIPFHVIIPARLQSQRLPNKLILDIHGMSVLERSYRQACQSNATSVTIACDHPLLFQLAQTFGAACIMTGEHQSGTDRIAEALSQSCYQPDDIIVNLQADEPFINPLLINQVVEVLAHSKHPMATLCWPVKECDELLNPNVVKVVMNHEFDAMYFSRSPIPMHRDSSESIKDCYRHIGIYAYRASFLSEFVSLPQAPVEQYECLEQLRALWHGKKIAMAIAKVSPSQDINTIEDLERARLAMASCAIDSVDVS